MSVGQRIKQRRLELGITQIELAERLGLKNKSSICKIETDKESNLTADRIAKFARALNTNPAYLLELTNDSDVNLELNDEYERGNRDAEIMSIVRKLNNANASLLKEFAQTLLNSQGGM